MSDARALASDLLARLARAAPNGRPDGRPLHQYRFDRGDFDACRELLRGMGASALHNLYGSALFVAFTAEWFRRDRIGGHWDWKRPLAAIGLVYGQDDPRATVAYGEVAEALEAGLRWWGRPRPSDGDRIVAIVRESGFPGAALRENRRITDWLRHSVREIERGFDPRDAVGHEAWRMNATRIVHATFEAAVDLCEAIVRLRRVVRDRDPTTQDPIAVLDAAEPQWRSSLPFELEPQDVAAVVETVIRAAAESATALFAIRRLRRTPGDWRPTAAVALSGPIDPRRMPPSVADALQHATRVRVVPRGDLMGSTTLLAVLERTGEDEADPRWWSRAVAVDFEATLSLDAEVRLGVMVGDALVEEFPAQAGQSYAGEVLAFEPAGPGDPADCQELIALGCSPVRARGPWLALAVPSEVLSRLSIQGDRRELGTVEARTLIAFSGVASLVCDGVRLVWRTDADRAAASRLVFAGPTMRRPRETVYAGLPRVWIESDELVRACRQEDLRWRPVGRGRWRPLSDGAHWGRISIGVFASDELRAFANLIVVPPELELKPAPQRRGLVVTGAAEARLSARAGRILAPTTDGKRTFLDLSDVEPGQTVELRLVWEAEADLSLSNPITRQALISPQGRMAPRHRQLSIGRLHGWRLVTAEPARLVFELAAASDERRTFTRTVFGEAPLIAYLEDLRNLLGTSDDLDAAVRLTWTGAAEWCCEIRWYDLDPGSYEQTSDNLFGASRLAILGVAGVRVLSLSEPSRGLASVAANEAGFAGHLRSMCGDGPWLVYGTASDGRILRPRIADDGGRGEFERSPYVSAVGCRVPAERQRRLFELASDPATWSDADRRRWLDLCCVAAAERLPYAALDPLRTLDRRPAAAVWLLAFAETVEEQAAVLALQRELPFLWACTAMGDWLAAFEARLAFINARLETVKLSGDLAVTAVLSALGRIADQCPGLASRLRAVMLVLMTGRPNGGRHAFADLGDRLRRLVNDGRGMDLASRTNLFMQRHADGPPPPRDLGLVARAPAARSLVERFSGFDDVVAAPVAAATVAFTPNGADPALLKACRAAWLFDPEHFDATAALLVADWTAAGGPPPTETVR